MVIEPRFALERGSYLAASARHSIRFAPKDDRDAHEHGAQDQKDYIQNGNKGCQDRTPTPIIPSYPGYNLNVVKRKEQDEVWFWQIGSELQRLSDQMMQMLGTTAAVTQRCWKPKVDLSETDESLEISVEIAGVDPEAISVQFSPERHAVVVRGKREPQEAHCSVRCYQLEILYGEFERVVNLPDVAVDRNAIKARFVNGMLYISVPKKEETPGRRTVPITQE